MAVSMYGGLPAARCYEVRAAVSSAGISILAGLSAAIKVNCGIYRNVLVTRHRTIYILTLCTLLFGAMAVGMLHAQGGMQIGPIAGYEFGVPLAITRANGAVNGHEARGVGTSYNNSYRAGALFGFPSLFSDGAGVMVRAGYLRTSGQFHSTFPFDREFDPITESIVPSIYQLRVASATAALELELRVGVRVADRWAVDIRPWFTRTISTSFTTTLRKLSPLPAGSGFRDSIVPESASTAASWRGGIGIGGSYRIALGDKLQLQPELGGRLDIGALSDGLGFRRSASAGAGIALLFDISPSAPADTPRIAVLPPPVPPTVPPTVPARPDTPANARAHDDSVRAAASALLVSIDIYSIDSSGAQTQSASIVSRLLRQRRQTPFPETIYFDDGDSTPPARYVRVTPQEAEGFTPGSLARRTSLQVHAQALNLLGLRLKENPDATVTLKGSASANEPAGLARERAEAVREYLRTVWAIEERRISVEIDSRAATARAQPEFERHVQIESSVPAITAPVAAEWRARTFQLPPLDIQPVIKAKAGVRNWEVTVRQGTDVITHYSNRPGDEGTTDLALHIPDDWAELSLPPLVAELDVIDSAGDTRIARDSLALVIEPPQAGPNGIVEISERSTYLLLPENDVSDFSRGNSGALRDIAAVIHAGDRIIIDDDAAGHGAGVADALRRLLHARGVKVELRAHSPGGAAPDASPEGRLLASGITVLVERGVAGGEGRQ